MSCTLAAHAQNIGINATGAAPAASAMLDITATDRGLLIPRVALTATNSALPVTTPADALLVYNTATAGTAPNNVTPGYYYYSTASSTWLPILSGVKGWTTTGNYGTVAGTNYLGTNDAQALVVKTGGTATTNERLRVLSTGELVMNSTAYFVGDVFSVYGTGRTSAISALGTSAVNGYATGDGIGVYGESYSATGSTNGIAGIFIHDSPNSPNNDISAGLYALNTSAPLNAASGANCFGMLGSATGTAPALGGSTIGVYGEALSATNSATGVVGTGGGTAGAYYTMTSGSGASFSGNAIGSISFGLNSNGNGVIGVSNPANIIITPNRGAGVVGVGDQYGVVGFNQQNLTNTNQLNSQSTTLNNNAGGYFELGNNTGAAQTWSYVATRVGGTLYKIHGSGVTGTIVEDLDGKYVGLACPESPEVLFQDYGTAHLVEGRAHVEIDPRFTKHITVNNEHPLRVFVQLEGDCAGVFVTNKTASGFDVVELNGGQSNAAFSYTVIANRADEVMPDGTISKYADVRFPPAPGPAEKTTFEVRENRVIDRPLRRSKESTAGTPRP
ncbi:MAG: hypothetical protein IT230_10770 [Flavobacteriales bacterium]|nr:hypothetical protein [Flavobacteriales bacterium]